MTHPLVTRGWFPLGWWWRGTGGDLSGLGSVLGVRIRVCHLWLLLNMLISEQGRSPILFHYKVLCILHQQRVYSIDVNLALSAAHSLIVYPAFLLLYSSGGPTSPLTARVFSSGPHNNRTDRSILYLADLVATVMVGWSQTRSSMSSGPLHK